MIDNYDSFVYNLKAYFEELGREILVKRSDEITLDEIEDLKPEGIILSPGPKRPRDAALCVETVRRFQKRIPILGVCLGHQAIAECLGAHLQQLDHPKHGHASPLFITDSADTLYHEITTPMQVGRYHSWIVDPQTLPPCLKISAVDEEGNIMSFYHESLPLHGVQYHPESIITSHGKEIISNWLTL